MGFTNLKPPCPTCAQPMRQLKQVAKEANYRFSLTKGFCTNCNAWKDVTPAQKEK